MAALNILTHSQGNQRPRTPYENTFKMKPDLKVNAAAIEKIIANVLKVQLEEEKYDPKATKQVVSINCAKNLLFNVFCVLKLLMIPHSFLHSCPRPLQRSSQIVLSVSVMSDTKL